MARPILLLAILLLAGCANPPADEDPALDAPEWILVDPSGPGSEPMLSVGPDGALYLQAIGREPESARGEAWMWRSDDAGRTWMRLGIPAEPLTGQRMDEGSIDAAIEASPDGRIWFASAFESYFILFHSDDRGESWQEGAYPFFPPSHRMWLVASDDRQLDVGLDTLGGPTFHFHVDESSTNVMPNEVAPNYDVGGSLARRDADGLLLWPRHESAPMDRYIAYRSEDEGATWTSAPITAGETPETFPATPARRTSIWTPTAFDDNGTAFFAVSAMASGTSAILLTRSLDGGLTWAPFVALTLENETAALPWMDARGDGDLAIAYYGHDAPGAPDAADARWAPKLLRARWPADADAPEVEPLALPERIVFEGAICTYGQGCPDDQRPLGEYPAVAFAGPAIVAAFASPPDAEAFDATPLAITVPLRDP